jgi:hypothetical protein
MSRTVGRLYVIEPEMGRCSRCRRLRDVREQVCDDCRTEPEQRALQARIEIAIERAELVIDNQRGFRLPDTEAGILRAVGQSLPS